MGSEERMRWDDFVATTRMPMDVLGRLGPLVMAAIERLREGPTPIAVAAMLPTLTILLLVYAWFAPRFPDERRRAYILSVLSSSFMTLSSLPFLWVYFTSGSGLKGVWYAGQTGILNTIAQWVVGAFGTYLGTDLAVGYFCYPSQVSLVTGWIHHLSYMLIMFYLGVFKQAPVFLVASIMEVPTFDLAISNIFPAVRSDERFLGLMVLTRILFNIVLLVDAARPSTRAVTEGSWMPTVILALALVLHSTWMHGGVKGYLKRRARAKAAATSAEKIAVDDVAASQPELVADTGSTTPDDSPLVTPHTPSQPTTLIRDGIFPAITMPTMANIPIPNIPTLSGMAAALPQAKANLDNLNFALKEAVRERRERWEERYERLTASAGMLRRRHWDADDTNDVEDLAL